MSMALALLRVGGWVTVITFRGACFILKYSCEYTLESLTPQYLPKSVTVVFLLYLVIAVKKVIGIIMPDRRVWYFNSIKAE